MNICNHCSKIIENKPYMSYNNNGIIKHTCNYICTKYNETVGLCNIININDFTKYPIPHINFKEILNTSNDGDNEDFYLLNDQQLNELNNEDLQEYYDALEQIYSSSSDDDMSDTGL